MADPAMEEQLRRVHHQNSQLQRQINAMRSMDSSADADDQTVNTHLSSNGSNGSPDNVTEFVPESSYYPSGQGRSTTTDPSGSTTSLSHATDVMVKNKLAASYLAQPSSRSSRHSSTISINYSHHAPSTSSQPKTREIFRTVDLGSTSTQGRSSNAGFKMCEKCKTIIAIGKFPQPNSFVCAACQYCQDTPPPLGESSVDAVLKQVNRPSHRSEATISPKREREPTNSPRRPEATISPRRCTHSPADRSRCSSAPRRDSSRSSRSSPGRVDSQARTATPSSNVYKRHAQQVYKELAPEGSELTALERREVYNKTGHRRPTASARSFVSSASGTNPPSSRRSSRPATARSRSETGRSYASSGYHDASTTVTEVESTVGCTESNLSGGGMTRTSSSHSNNGRNKSGSSVSRSSSVPRISKEASAVLEQMNTQRQQSLQVSDSKFWQYVSGKQQESDTHLRQRELSIQQRIQDAQRRETQSLDILAASPSSYGDEDRQSVERKQQHALVHEHTVRFINTQQQRQAAQWASAREQQDTFVASVHNLADSNAHAVKDMMNDTLQVQQETWRGIEQRLHSHMANHIVDIQNLTQNLPDTTAARVKELTDNLSQHLDQYTTEMRAMHGSRMREMKDLVTSIVAHMPAMQERLDSSQRQHLQQLVSTLEHTSLLLAERQQTFYREQQELMRRHAEEFEYQNIRQHSQRLSEHQHAIMQQQRQSQDTKRRSGPRHTNSSGSAASTGPRRTASPGGASTSSSSRAVESASSSGRVRSRPTTVATPLTNVVIPSGGAPGPRDSMCGDVMSRYGTMPQPKIISSPTAAGAKNSGRGRAASSALRSQMPTFKMHELSTLAATSPTSTLTGSVTAVPVHHQSRQPPADAIKHPADASIRHGRPATVREPPSRSADRSRSGSSRSRSGGKRSPSRQTRDHPSAVYDYSGYGAHSSCKDPNFKSGRDLSRHNPVRGMGEVTPRQSAAFRSRSAQHPTCPTVWTG